MLSPVRDLVDPKVDASAAPFLQELPQGMNETFAHTFLPLFPSNADFVQ
jgi:hypothetical protein